MTPSRAQELLGKSTGRRVLLVGDLMLDEWVFGTVIRISPEAPIPIVHMPLTEDARVEKPGGAGNVAAILLGLGATVKVLGIVGDDERGARLLSDLAARGADVSAVLTDPSRPTTHKVRIIAGRQQLLRIDTERSDPASPSLARELRDRLAGEIGKADAVLAADYAKGALTLSSLPGELVSEVRRAGIPFCADPKPANIELFRGVSLISPNESEALAASRLVGALPTARDSEIAEAAEAQAGTAIPPPVISAGWALREKLASEAVFVTRGEHGIAVFSGEREVTVVASQTDAGAVGDGTGCGDAVSAMSALALAAGAGYVEAAVLANAAGGVVSRFVGVHNPSPAEILDWLGRHPQPPAAGE